MHYSYLTIILDDAEHDMKDCADQGRLLFALVVGDLHNLSYHMKVQFTLTSFHSIFKMLIAL